MLQLEQATTLTVEPNEHLLLWDRLSNSTKKLVDDFCKAENFTFPEILQGAWGKRKNKFLLEFALAELSDHGLLETVTYLDVLEEKLASAPDSSGQTPVSDEEYLSMQEDCQNYLQDPGRYAWMSEPGLRLRNNFFAAVRGCAQYILGDY